MKKFLSILLALTLLICTFAGCNKDNAQGDETTSSTIAQTEESSTEKENSTVEKKSEVESTESKKESESTTEKPTEKPTEKATEKPTEKPTVKPTVPAGPTLQLHKTYSSGHEYDDKQCYEKTLCFENGGQVAVIWNFIAYTEYDSTQETEVPDFHEHNGVKYYYSPYGEGGGYDTYTVSGNKITTGYEGNYTIISNNSIKGSDGVVYTIIS